MKNFKNPILTMILIAGISMGAWAGTSPEIPQEIDDGTETGAIDLSQVSITAPTEFDEGTETKLPDQLTRELIPWATNSKLELEELLDFIKTQNFLDQKRTLIQGIRDTVLASAPKRTELLMRYVLNRGLKVVDILEQEADSSVAGVLDQQVRVLKQSVQMALKYYENDLAYLNSQSKKDLVNLPFAQFGMEYAVFLMELNKSVLDASAQYEIGITALGLLQWDLYRDSARQAYAPAIMRIQAFLKMMPEKAGTNDIATVQRIRQIKKKVQQVMELVKGVIAAEQRKIEEAELQRTHPEFFRNGKRKKPFGF